MTVNYNYGYAINSANQKRIFCTMGLTMTVHSDLTMSSRRGTRLIGHSIDHVLRTFP